jgi:hypothetical protein
MRSFAKINSTESFTIVAKLEEKAFTSYWRPDFDIPAVFWISECAHNEGVSSFR